MQKSDMCVHKIVKFIHKIVNTQRENSSHVLRNGEVAGRKSNVTDKFTNNVKCYRQF